MDYYESADGIEVTRKRAFQEARKHGADLSAFRDYLDTLDTLPEASPGMYQAQDILDWLGY